MLAVQAVTAAAASAWQRARLFDEIRRREQWLITTGEIRARLLSVDTVREALALIAARTADATSADGALVLLPEGQGEMRPAAMAGSQFEKPGDRQDGRHAGARHGPGP